MSQSLKINKIVVDVQNNQAFIICPPSRFNESGAFRVSRQQLENMAAQAGLVGAAQLIRHAKGSTLTFEAKNVKAGEKWLNKKSGEEGEYTKDHCRITEMAVELSQSALFVIEAAANSANAFQNMVASVLPAAHEAEEFIEDEQPEEAQIVQPVITEQA